MTKSESRNRSITRSAIDSGSGRSSSSNKLTSTRRGSSSLTPTKRTDLFERARHGVQENLMPFMVRFVCVPVATINRLLPFVEVGHVAHERYRAGKRRRLRTDQRIGMFNEKLLPPQLQLRLTRTENC